MFVRNQQYFRFCAYGFLKNLRFFEPFLILFLLDENMTFSQIGILYAIREITRNLFEIPGGIFADSFGRIKSMVLAFSAYLISFLLFYVSGSFWSFSLAFVLYAFGDAFRTGTHKAIILTYLNSKGWAKYKVDYYGHTRSWSQIGSGISALVAGAVVLLSHNYRLAFLLAIVPYVLDLINLATYPKNLDFPQGGSLQKSKKVPIKETLNDFRSAIKNPAVFTSIIGLSSYTGYYKAAKDYIQPLIQALALSLPITLIQSNTQKEAILVGIIYFLVFMITARVARYSGTWVKRWKNDQKAMNRSLVLGVLSGLISGILVLFGLNFLAIVFFFGIYIFENLRKPIGIGKIATDLDEKVLASALSVESQAETIFAALFAITIGFLADQFSLGVSLVATSLIIILLYLLITLRKAPGHDSGF